MSSKRGRKRNDNLPPNRARDVQRAFRARRAAHLQALEQRVAELEQENDCLRMSMRIPLSTRPPLGKGPTGKDKARALDPSMSHSLCSRESSTIDSPPSRETSASPSGIPVSMSHSTHPMTVIDPNNWDDTLLMDEQRHINSSGEAGPSDMSYHMSPNIPPPIPAPLAVKLYPYNQSFSSSSRPVALYSETPAPYSTASNRIGGQSYSASASGFNLHNETRDDSPRTHYVYSQSFASHDANVHSQTPSPSLNHPSHNHNHNHNHNHTHPHNQQPTNLRESPLPFNTHRRALNDNQGFSIGQGFPHLPNPSHPLPNGRSGSSDYARQQDHMHPHSGPSRYDSDGRHNPPS